jgi:hypothetical protein
MVMLLHLMIRDMKIIKNYFAAIRKNEVFMHSWND